MSKSSGKNSLKRVTVAVTVEVDLDEWMKVYGDYIRANQLVPEVTIEQSVRRAVKEKLEGLGIPTLAVDKPYNTKPKTDKGLHS